MTPGQRAQGRQLAGALAAGGPGPTARQWREQGRGLDQARAAPAWRPRAALPPPPPPPQRLSQRQAWMQRPRFGPASLVAPAATWGDGAAAATPGGAGRGARARCSAAAAGAYEAWRALRRRRGDRSARGARPRLQRHPPSGDPRGVRGAGPVSRPPLNPQRARRPLRESPIAHGPRAGDDSRVAPPPPHLHPRPRPADPGSSSSPPPPILERKSFHSPKPHGAGRREGEPRCGPWKAGSQGSSLRLPVPPHPPRPRVRVSTRPSPQLPVGMLRSFPAHRGTQALPGAGRLQKGDAALKASTYQRSGQRDRQE